MCKKYFGMLALVAAMFLTACSQKEAYLEAIPNESIVIGKIDVATLIVESEIANEPIVSGGMRDGINSLDEDTRQLLRKIIDNPEESGIDVRKPLVGALVDALPNPTGVFTLAVKDKAKLANFITTVTNDSHVKGGGQDDFLELVEKDNATVINIMHMSVAAFDNDKLVIAAAQRNMDAMEFMSLNSKKQAVNDNRFSRFFDAKADVAMIYDYEKVMDLAQLAAGRSGINGLNNQALNDIFEGLMFLYTCNFEKGEINNDFYVMGNDNFEKLTQKFVQKTSKRNLECIPQNASLVYNVGIRNLGEFFDVLALDANTKSDIEKAFAEINLTTDDLNEFEGDLTFALLPFAELSYHHVPMPVIMAECKGRKVFDSVSKLLQDDSKLKLVETDVYACNANTSDQYNWETGEYETITAGNDLYIGFKDNILFLMPSDLYDQTLASGKRTALKENFKASRLYSDLGNLGGIVFDAKAFFNEPIVAEECKSLPLDVTTLFDNLVAESNEAEGSLDIRFQNKNDNALKIIKDLAMQIVAKQ